MGRTAGTGVHAGLTAALGTVQMVGGALTLGLGPARTSTRPGDFTSLGAAYWLGAVFIVSGIMSVLAGQFPSSCLMGFGVFLNLACGVFAVCGVVLYAVDLGDASLLWICGAARPDGDSCRQVALFAQKLLTNMDFALIILSVLLLLVCIVFSVLGIRFLIGKAKDDEDEIDKQEQLLLKSP